MGAKRRKPPAKMNSLPATKVAARRAKGVRGGAWTPGTGGLITETGFPGSGGSGKEPGPIDVSDVNLVWKKP